MAKFTAQIFQSIVFVTLLCIAGAAFGLNGAAAEDVHEKTVLTIIGANGGDAAVTMTLMDIKALPAVTFTTFDPWTKQERTYTGPRIIDILTAAKIDPETKHVEITAKDDYKAFVSLSDLKKIGHVMSYAMNGVDYTQRKEKLNKGPLAIAIDFETSKADVEIYMHQLAWNVSTIEAK